MLWHSINPATGELRQSYRPWETERIEKALAAVAAVTPSWAATPLGARAELLRSLAQVLRNRKTQVATLMTAEMGKLLREAEAEVIKCAWVCDYYAEQAAAFLADESLATEARKSLVTYPPLGTLLAIMPWNFPFWQVIRCAVPALAAGNTLVLKHAANVPECALSLQELFAEAGFPSGVFTTLLITGSQAMALIGDPRIQAVSLTGSEEVGRLVAAEAGRHLKKAVLELGGSDPFVILEDAELETTVTTAVNARFLNAGQSCIAAKRFIVVEAIAEAFLLRFAEAIRRLRPGDPLDPATSLAPLARADLREQLQQQVQTSLELGAQLVLGGEILPGPGYFYAPTLLDRVQPGMPAYGEELFGPVAAVIRVRDEVEALRVANDSRFGLGGSVWTGDRVRGEAFARRLACGGAFVNAMVKSDPRLPFGGIKASGYGRELSLAGIREFVNIQSLWIG